MYYVFKVLDAVRGKRDFCNIDRLKLRLDRDSFSFSAETETETENKINIV